jgi:hypothetical protein
MVQLADHFTLAERVGKKDHFTQQDQSGKEA